MRPSEELGCDTGIFEWEIYVESMSDFVGIHVQYRHWGYSTICLWHLYLEFIVANRVLQL